MIEVVMAEAPAMGGVARLSVAVRDHGDRDRARNIFRVFDRTLLSGGCRAQPRTRGHRACALPSSSASSTATVRSNRHRKRCGRRLSAIHDLSAGGVRHSAYRPALHPEIQPKPTRRSASKATKAVEQVEARPPGDPSPDPKACRCRLGLLAPKTSGKCLNPWLRPPCPAKRFPRRNPGVRCCLIHRFGRF